MKQLGGLVTTLVVVSVAAVAGFVVVLMLLLRDGGDSDGGQPVSNNSALPMTSLSRAYDSCQAQGGVRYVVDEDIAIVRGPAVKSVAAGKCMLKALDASAATLDRLRTTTSLMGQVTDRVGDYDLAWTYHPENGLNMTIEPSA